MSTPETTTHLADAGVDDWLINALQRIARSEDRSLEPYLVDVGEAQVLDQTAPTAAVITSASIRKLAPGRGADRHARRPGRRLLHPSQPNRRGHDHMVRTGSTAKVLQLQREAKALFTTVQISGEGGELLLYALLEIALGVPQILCKMSLKTNPTSTTTASTVYMRRPSRTEASHLLGEAKLYGDAQRR